MKRTMMAALCGLALLAGPMLGSVAAQGQPPADALTDPALKGAEVIAFMFVGYLELPLARRIIATVDRVVVAGVHSTPKTCVMWPPRWLPHFHCWWPTCASGSASGSLAGCRRCSSISGTPPRPLLPP